MIAEGSYEEIEYQVAFDQVIDVLKKNRIEDQYLRMAFLSFFAKGVIYQSASISEELKNSAVRQEVQVQNRQEIVNTTSQIQAIIVAARRYIY